MTRFRAPATRQCGEPHFDPSRLADRSVRSARRRCCATSRGASPPAPGVVVGLGDDAAAVETRPFTLVTTDSLVEGVHFLRDAAPPRLLGRKALTVNLSDVGGDGRHRALRHGEPLPAARPHAGLGGLALRRPAGAGGGGRGGPRRRQRDARPRVDRRRRHPARRRGAAPAAHRRPAGRPRGRHRDARARRPRACASSPRARASTRTAELVATGVWTESSAPAVLGLPARPARPAPAARARPLDRRARPRAGGDGPLGRPVARPRRDLLAGAASGAVVDASAVPVDPRAAGLERARGGDALALALHGGEDYQLLLAVGAGGARRARRARAGLGRRGRRRWASSSRGSPWSCAARRGRGAARSSPGGHDHFRVGAGLEGRRACGGCAGRGRSCSTSRTARRAWPLAFALGVFIAFFPILGIHTGHGPRARGRLPPEQGGDPASGPGPTTPGRSRRCTPPGTLLGCAVLGVSPASLGDDRLVAAAGGRSTSRSPRASARSCCRSSWATWSSARRPRLVVVPRPALAPGAARSARPRRRARAAARAPLRPAGASSWWRVVSLVGGARAQERRLVERAAEELQADGQARRRGRRGATGRGGRPGSRAR